MAIEVGKNRIEALGEVEESADLLRYYAQTMEDNDGYDHPMGNLGDAAVHTRSILRPHGVFAVISPFNFPMALAAGPTGAALLAGNTVVLKPSSASPLSAVKLIEAYRRCRRPGRRRSTSSWARATRSARRSRTTPASTASCSPARTRSGCALFHSFSRDWPRPTIVEMGGKNPAIVTRNADLDEAAEGIMRSAFGFSGQKCSANSRVYVERPVHDELDPAARREDRGAHHRRPADPGQLAGSGHRPARSGPPPGRGRRGAPRRDGLHRRRAPGRQRHGPRLLRRAHRRRRPAVLAPAVPRRAVRAVDRGRGRRVARRGDRASPTTRSTG